MSHRYAAIHFLKLLTFFLVLPVFLGGVSLACAQGGGRQPEPLAAPVVSSVPISPVTLADCMQMALQRQPRIAVERANLAAAEDAKRALDELRLAAVVDREIPVRRQQACLGIEVAAAGLAKAEQDTVYAVTRTYYTVVYAREQERIAQSVVERLSALHDAAKAKLDAGDADIKNSDVNKVLVYLRSAQAKRVQATQGVKRALASLREAIGLEPEFHLELSVGHLPDPDVHPTREMIVALATTRRPDLMQANLFEQLTCLEIDAQGTSLLPRMQTFAAGGDIHGTQVPQGVHNDEYRPGAVPPAMPVTLVGSRAERMKRAESFHARAAAVVEVTHNLITLEAEDAFLRWEEATNQVPAAREAAAAGDKVAEELTKGYNANLKVRTDEVVTARVLAAQSQAQHNEYLYHKILTLADLERITAGGFCAKLVEAAGSK